MLFLLFPITMFLSISLTVSISAFRQHTSWLAILQTHSSLRICANRLASLANFDHATLLAGANSKAMNGPANDALDFSTCEAKALSLGYELQQQGSDYRKSKVPNYIPRLYETEPSQQMTLHLHGWMN